MQPEFLAALQILAGFRRDFTDRFGVNRTLKIEHRKIAHLQSAPGHIHKVCRLIAQPFQRRFDFGIRNFRVRQLHRDVLVIRKVELWRGHHGCAKPHRLVLAELDVFDVGQ